MQRVYVLTYCVIDMFCARSGLLPYYDFRTYKELSTHKPIAVRVMKAADKQPIIKPLVIATPTNKPRENVHTPQIKKVTGQVRMCENCSKGSRHDLHRLEQ